MNKITTYLISTFKTLTLVVVLGIGTYYAQAAWTSAPANPPSNNVEAPINVGSIDQLKDGGLGVNSLGVFGDGVFTGTIKSSNANGIRLTQGSFGLIMRNDGTNFWLLPTASGDPDGTWSALRPFSYRFSTGRVSIAQTLYADDGGNGGNVGIGKFPGTYKLDVNGDANATRLCIGTDCRSAWPVGTGGTTYTGGDGITITGTDIKVDGTVQRTIATSCNGANQSIKTISITGAVTCETDDVGTGGGSGTITGVTAGNGLTGGGTTGTVTVNAVAAAGSGLVMAADSIDTNPLVLQMRVAGTCIAGQYMRAIDQAGAVTCQADNTGLITGLSLTDNYVVKANGTTGLQKSLIYDNDTNVGIGTTAPGQKLDVVGSIKASASMYATAFYYSSDKNLKTNIATLSNSLSKILSLRGVSFNWKDTGRKDIGVVAQEVEKAFPEAVLTDKTTGLKSVEYGNLVGPLIEAVKEQQKQIEDLKREVEMLKNK